MGEEQTATQRKDFFISYTSSDRRWAEWVAWQLEAAGYQTIIQAWDFPPGSNFIAEMDEASKVAERTVAVLSPKYVASDYAFAEWAAALREDPTGKLRKLLPIRVASFDVAGLLGPVVSIDLVGLDEQAAHKRLLNGVSMLGDKHGKRDKPPTPVSFPGILPSSAPLKSLFTKPLPSGLPSRLNRPFQIGSQSVLGSGEMDTQAHTSKKSADSSLLTAIQPHDNQTRPNGPPAHANETHSQTVQKPPSFPGSIHKHKNKLLFLGIPIILAVVVILVSCGSYVYSLSFIENRAYCLSQWPSAICSNGIGISSVTIDGNEYRIGLADENAPTPFHPSDTTEAGIEKLIFAENENAKQAKAHFTIVLLTTLSTSPLDPNLSLSVGLEDLRGAYLAQHNFNTSHTDLKLRLLIGNLGTKNVVDKTASLVASQVVLFMRNGGADNHTLGVIGLPFSATALAVLPLLHKYGVTGISSSAITDDLSTDRNADPSEFHRILPENSQQTPYIQRFILEVLHPANTLIIHSNDSYSETLAKELAQKLHDNNTSFSETLAKELAQKLHDNNTSFDEATYQDGNISQNLSQILGKLQETNVDLVVFTGFPNDLDAMLTQMKQQNIPFPKWIMGGGALYEIGGYTNGNYAYPLIFPSFVFPDAPEQYARDYQAAYKKAFDPNNEHSGEYGFQRAGPHSASEYDAVLAYIQAISNTGELDAGRVQQALQTVSFNGATGATIFMHGSVNPGNKTLYIVCVDQSGHTHALWTYYPNSGGKNKKDEDMSVCNAPS